MTRDVRRQSYEPILEISAFTGLLFEGAMILDLMDVEYVIFCLNIGSYPVSRCPSKPKHLQRRHANPSRAIAKFSMDLSTVVTRNKIQRAFEVNRGDISADVPITLTIHVENEPVRSVELLIDRKLEDKHEFFYLDHSSLDDLYERGDNPTCFYDGKESQKNTPRLICFYLPQFHPFSENDQWWGQGFTEWNNVSQAKKRFSSHNAPWFPADMGFYDLRVKETRRMQAELALQYGIDGFCYYVYWFQGRRLMELPLQLMLADGEPNIPYCLCWANENWSRRWDGSETEILIAQDHSFEGDRRFIDDLVDIIDNPLYIRVDGKAVILIYRPSLISDRSQIFEYWRFRARELGIGEILICNVMTFGDYDPRLLDCDFAIEFPPHTASAKKIDIKTVDPSSSFEGDLYRYQDVVAKAFGKSYPFPYFPAVMPRWDNTPRKGDKGTVFIDSTPELFEIWLRDAVARSTSSRRPDPLVFINSWNEWAEGAHLEPDSLTGRKYLEAVRRVKVGEPVLTTSIGHTSLVTGIEPSFMISDLKKMSFYLNTLASAQNAPTVCSQLIEGQPPMRSAASSPPSAQFIIESICSQNSSVVVCRPGVEMVIRGWSYIDEYFNPIFDRTSFLVFLPIDDDKSVWFTPTIDWYDRLDIKEHFKTSTTHVNYGFETKILLGQELKGKYNLAIIEYRKNSAYLVKSHKSVYISE